MASKSSKSSKGEGNTKNSPSPKKQISPAIRWCFTLNNWSEEEHSSIVLIIQSACRCGMVAKEIAPTTGTPHLQGYIEFIKKARPISVFKNKRIQFKKCKGTKDENVVYCSKEDKNPFIHNIRVKKPVKTISLSEMYPWQKEILEAIAEEPDDRTVHWYWSHDGGIGKTAFCKYLTVHHHAICLHGKGADVRNGVVAHMEKDGGQTPELIVYPIPRCHGSEYVSYEAIENIKDMYFYSGKYEGGMVCGNPPHLIVFANEPPKESKLSLDRWHIVCIDPENAPSESPKCLIDPESSDDD